MRGTARRLPSFQAGSAAAAATAAAATAQGVQRRANVFGLFFGGHTRRHVRVQKGICIFVLQRCMNHQSGCGLRTDVVAAVAGSMHSWSVC